MAYNTTMGSGNDYDKAKLKQNQDVMNQIATADKATADRKEAAWQKPQKEIEDRNTQYDVETKKAISGYQSGKKPYLQDLDNSSKQYESGRKQLMREAEGQANDATQTYADLSSKMRKSAEDSSKEAGNAMTLAQLADPANSAAFNNYNGIFQNQAQNEGRQGQADYGVLASLGAKATGNGMAGMGPMTAGQQAAMMAGSQRQAGEAYANTQRRMQSLRDQGLQTGLAAHQNQYDMGQQARNFNQQVIGNSANLQSQAISGLGSLRGERGGYQGDIAGAQSGRAMRGLGNLQEDFGMNQGFRGDVMQRGNALSGAQQTRQDVLEGRQMAKEGAAAQASAQESAGNKAMIGAGIGAIGTIGGAAVGSMAGPVGTAAGASLGGAAGNALGSQVAGDSMGAGSAGRYNLGVQQPVMNQGFGQPQAQPQAYMPQSRFGLSQRFAS